MSQPQRPINVPSRKDFENNLKVDVAVIGAGASGLYTGYRLINGDFAENSTPPQTIHIFDVSDRIGGRLESVTLPGMGNVIGELGGMRYMTSQKIVTSLVDKVFKGELTGSPELMVISLSNQKSKLIRDS